MIVILGDVAGDRWIVVCVPVVVMRPGEMGPLSGFVVNCFAVAAAKLASLVAQCTGGL